jgi:hypothetical protein
MNAVVIEHVKVGDLPEAWRERIAKPSDARVTVRIEEETARGETASTRLKAGEAIEDPAFGIWRDRDDIVNVDAYVRKVRAPRYNRDGTRNEG